MTFHASRSARRDGARARGAFKAAAIVGGGVALAAVFTRVVDTFLDRLFGWNPIASAIMAFLLVACIVWYFFFSQTESLSRLIRSDAKELDAADLTARPFLVTGHSTLQAGAVANIRQIIAAEGMPDVAGLCRAGEASRQLVSWQQSLRVVHFLRDRIAGNPDRRLRRVAVIDNGALCEDGTPQVALFAAFLRTCFPGLEVRTIPEGAERERLPLRVDRVHEIEPDYETYDYVTTAFDRAFESLAQGEAAGREVVEASSYIDVTPGTKVFSIAAAIQTLNRRAIFLYVTSHTNLTKEAQRPEGYQIFGYDADAQFDLGSGR